MPVINLNNLRTTAIVIHQNLIDMGYLPDDLHTQEDFSIRQMIVDVFLDELEAAKTDVEKAMDSFVSSMSGEELTAMSVSLRATVANIEKTILEVKDGKEKEG